MLTLSWSPLVSPDPHAVITCSSARLLLQSSKTELGIREMVVAEERFFCACECSCACSRARPDPVAVDTSCDQFVEQALDFQCCVPRKLLRVRKRRCQTRHAVCTFVMPLYTCTPSIALVRGV